MNLAAAVELSVDSAQGDGVGVVVACRRALVLFATLGLCSCASPTTRLEIQRPAASSLIAVAVPQDHPLYGGVVLDYVSGMPRRSLGFAKPDQELYLPALKDALYRSGLQATSAASARYALQVVFEDLAGPRFGADFVSRSRATYRIVDHKTGAAVFERSIEARFTARFVGLSPDDPGLDLRAPPGLAATGVQGPLLPLHSLGRSLSKAATVALLGGGPDDVANAFRRDYQGLVVNEGLAIISVALPGNFIAGGMIGGPEGITRAKTLQGDMSIEGYGSRDGSLRAAQANRQMIRQSLAKFLLALGADQKIPLTHIVPCRDSAEIAALKAEIVARGDRWISDDCRAYGDRPRDPPSLVIQ